MPSSTGGRTSSARDLSLVISNHRLLLRFPPHGARNFYSKEDWGAGSPGQGPVPHLTEHLLQASQSDHTQ